MLIMKDLIPARGTQQNWLLHKANALAHCILFYYHVFWILSW